MVRPPAARGATPTPPAAGPDHWPTADIAYTDVGAGLAPASLSATLQCGRWLTRCEQRPRCRGWACPARTEHGDQVFDDIPLPHPWQAPRLPSRVSVGAGYVDP